MGKARPADPLAAGGAADQRVLHGPAAALLLLEQGNHGCANLAPFHRYRTADWAADTLGARPIRGVKAP